MFTKPSLADLIHGISANAEQVVLPALAGRPEAQVLVDTLATLDRVAAEWSTTAALLAVDNGDIRATLTRIADGRSRAAQPLDPAGSDVASLAAENCRLKSAVIALIEELDLPASADAPAALRDADRQVRELLARMLEREGIAHPPTKPRHNPLSKAAAGLSEDARVAMAEALQAFIASEMPHASDVRVTNLRPLAGGASREAFVFDASWSAEADAITERCVLLRQPVASVLESDESATSFTGSRRVPEVEFRLIRCMEAAGVPVPHMLWLDTTGTVLDRPFSVARLIEGDADHTKLFDAPHRETILDQYIEILAQVHTLDLAAAGVDFLGDPTPETAASVQVELFADGVRRQQLEEFPALSYLIRWLRKNLPTASRISIVHGDFRLGNFMYDETGIVAMLDWEQAHLGDPVEELAFMYWPLWSLEPLVPIEELVRRYEGASGITVDPRSLAFYRAFIELKMSVVLLTGIRSFFATDHRQLAYGTSTALYMLGECQRRFIQELLDGRPAVPFRADGPAQPA